MKKRQAVQQKLESILKSKKFDELDEYRDQKSWPSLTSEEKSLLAMLFVEHGRSQLNAGNSDVLRSFELATELDPDDWKVLYDQACAYIDHAHNPRCLELASQALKKASEIEPSEDLIWLELADCLRQRGQVEADPQLFSESDRCYAQAEALIESSQNFELLPHIYINWGCLWHTMGCESGEPSDFAVALQKFELADTHESSPSTGFLCHYGESVMSLYSVLERDDLLTRALKIFERAVDVDPECSSALLHTALTLYKIYEKTEDEAAYLRASEMFSQAIQVIPDQSTPWLFWGQMVLLRAGETDDDALVHDAIEKLTTADALDPDDPHILVTLAEAQVMLGMRNESLEWLKTAEDTLQKAVCLDPRNPGVWAAYGHCLKAMGRYFGDKRYYERAIEQYERALGIEPGAVGLCVGIAEAYIDLGDIEGLSDHFLQAIKALKDCQEGQMRSASLSHRWGVACFKLAEMTGEQHWVQEAVSRFERAIEMREDQGKQALSEWRYDLGCAYDFLGDMGDNPSHYERSVQLLKSVLEEEPTHTHARYHLAMAQVHLGELTLDTDCFYQAINHFEEVIQQDSEDDVAIAELGITYLNLAELTRDPATPEITDHLFAQSEDFLRQALSLGHLGVYYHLACLHSLNGRYEQAMLHLNQAYEAKSMPPVQEVIQDEWLQGLRATAAFSEFMVRTGLSNGGAH